MAKITIERIPEMPGWFRLSRPGKGAACPWYLVPFFYAWMLIP